MLIQMRMTILYFRDMEAFLKTGKVGAGVGGSSSKPLGKEKKEKKQAPVSEE